MTPDFNPSEFQFGEEVEEHFGNRKKEDNKLIFICFDCHTDLRTQNVEEHRERNHHVQEYESDPRRELSTSQLLQLWQGRGDQ